MVLVALLTGTAALIGGCWDRHEINELSVVLTAAVDRDGEQWEFSVGLIRTTGQPSGGQAPGAGGGGAGGGAPGVPRAAFVVTARGSTLDEAIQNLRLYISRTLHWDHAILLVIGEAAARYGIQELLDMWTRHEAMRTTATLVVVRGKASDFVASLQVGLGNTLADEVTRIVELSQKAALTRQVAVHDLAAALSGEAHASLVPVFGVVALPQPPAPGTPPPENKGKASTGKSGAGGSSAERTHSEPAPVVQEGRYLPPSQPLASAQLQGGAVFLRDKLVGFLGLTEVRGVMWVVSPPREAIVAVPCPAAAALDPNTGPKADLVSVSVRKVIPRIRVTAERASIELSVQGVLESQACFREHEILGRAKAEGAEAALKVLAEAVSRRVSEEVKHSIAVTQAMGADVFGLATVLHRQHKQAWRAVQDRWEQVYRTLPVEVTVVSRISATGETIQPPDVKL